MGKGGCTALDMYFSKSEVMFLTGSALLLRYLRSVLKWYCSGHVYCHTGSACFIALLLS